MSLDGTARGNSERCGDIRGVDKVARATAAISGSWQQKSEGLRGERSASDNQSPAEPGTSLVAVGQGMDIRSHRPQCAGEGLEAQIYSVGRLRSGQARERPGNDCGGSGRGYAIG